MKPKHSDAEWVVLEVLMLALLFLINLPALVYLLFCHPPQLWAFALEEVRAEWQKQFQNFRHRIETEHERD